MPIEKLLRGRATDVGGLPVRQLRPQPRRAPGERIVRWNFVAGSHGRIEAAQPEWLAYERGSLRFPGVPGTTEFIPLPER